jgi:hypothetical protein
LALLVLFLGGPLHKQYEKKSAMLLEQAESKQNPLFITLLAS